MMIEDIRRDGTKVSHIFGKRNEWYVFSYDEAKYTCPKCGELWFGLEKFVPKSFKEAIDLVRLMNEIDKPFLGKLKVGEKCVSDTDCICSKCGCLWVVPRRFYRIAEKRYIFDFSLDISLEEHDKRMYSEETMKQWEEVIQRFKQEKSSLK